MVLPERPAAVKHLPRLGFERGTIAAACAAGESSLVLDRARRHYLERVRRLQIGDSFLLFDSSGGLWRAALTDAGADILEALHPQQRELPIELELAIAVTKGSGFDELVRQLTEVGVNRIVPLLTERSLVQPSAKKITRWQTIALEATEQCERVVVPIVTEPQLFNDWLACKQMPQDEGQTDRQNDSLVWIAAARAQNPQLLARLQQAVLQPQDRLAIAIGPEGGWSDRELELAFQAGAEGVRLGPRVLRAVTAPVALASVVGAWVEVSVWAKVASEAKD